MPPKPAPRPLAISAEEHATRLWLEALVAAGWSILHRWWDERPAATAIEREHLDPITVDQAIALMCDGQVRSFEFVGPGASFSICGNGLCGGSR